MKFDRSTEQQIRSRAHDVLLQQGSQPGHDLENWLQAEHELMQLRVRKVAELERPRAKQGNHQMVVV